MAFKKIFYKFIFNFNAFKCYWLGYYLKFKTKNT